MVPRSDKATCGAVTCPSVLRPCVQEGRSYTPVAPAAPNPARTPGALLRPATPPARPVMRLEARVPGTPPHQPSSSSSPTGATSPTEPLVATPDTGAAKPQSLRQRLRMRLADLAGFREAPALAPGPLAGSAVSDTATAHDTVTARAFTPPAGRRLGGRGLDQREGPESQEGRLLEQQEEQQQQQQQQQRSQGRQLQRRRRDSSGEPGSLAPHGNSQPQGVAPAAEGPGVQGRRGSDSAGSADLRAPTRAGEAAHLWTAHRHHFTSGNVTSPWQRPPAPPKPAPSPLVRVWGAQGHWGQAAQRLRCSGGSRGQREARRRQQSLRVHSR